MSTPTAKGIQIANQLAQKLTARFGTSLAVVQSFDTDQCPVVSVGPGTAGSKNAVFKVCGLPDPLSVDALGLGPNLFGPELVMLATEANPTAGAGADILDLQTLINLTGQASMAGCPLQWYQTANGVAPTTAAMTSGNLKATFWPDLKQQIRSAQ